jgi:hypothetical protein
MIEMILSFILAWVCTITGVALGGFLVFRTKREGYDSMFQFKQPQGESFNVEDDLGFNQDETKSTVDFPDSFRKHQDRFVDQFAESLAEKAAEK